MTHRRTGKHPPPAEGATPLRRTILSMALASAGDEPQRDALKLNRIGKDYYDKGYFTKALAAFEKAVELVNWSSIFAGNLGAAHLQLEDHEKALRVMGDWRFDKDYDVTIAVNLGAALGETGRPDQEEDWYREAAIRFGDDRDLLHNQVISLVQIGDAARGLETADKLIEAAPDWYRAYLVRGYALAALNRPNEEAAVYRQALIFAPSNKELLTNLGAVLREIGENQEAATVFSRLADIQPQNPQPRVDQAVCLWLGGRADEAEEVIGKALEIRAGYHPALTTAALFQVQAGEREEAVRTISRALELYPNSPETHFSHGLVLKLTSDYEGALEAFDRCLACAEKSDRDAVMLHKGEVLARMGRFTEARQLLSGRIQHKDGDVFGRTLEGRILREDGDSVGALAIAREAAGIDSKDVPSLRALGELFLDLESPNDAQDLFERVVAIHDRDVEAYHTLGVIHSKARRYDEAVALFEKAFRIKPDHAKSAYNLAMIHYTRNNYELARKVLDLAVKAAPDHVKARHLLAKTQHRLGNGQRAIEIWEETLPMRPNSSNIIKKLVQVSAELDDHSRVEKYFKMAKELKAVRAASNKLPDADDLD